MDPGQDDMGGHGADDKGLMDDLGGAAIAWPVVGLSGAVGCDVGGHEAMQAGGGEVVDGGQPDTARASQRAFVADLYGASDQELGVMAAPPAAGRRVARRAVSHRGLVDLDQACQGTALGRDHGAAQLGCEQSQADL